MTNPTSNYGFVLPTSADLVTDLPADFDVALQGVDTRLKALNPATTLGDLTYASSTANTNTRLAVGSTGQVLTVAGGVPSWANADAGGQNFTLLNSGGTALTGAQTITVSGISGKNTIHVLIFDASSDTAESIIRFRLNADSGANYSFAGMQLAANGVGNTSVNTVGTTGAAQIPIANMSTSASSTVNGGFTVSGANASGVKTIYSTGSGSVAGASFNTGTSFQGIYTGSSTISSISILSTAGNFDGGTVFVYVSA